MNKNIFISHYSGDKEIAETLAKTLKKISLGQINPWFSSDDSPDGGLLPGDIWHQQIINKITKSKALIAIITPNSFSRSWIYYECGIAETKLNSEVILVCVGFDRNNLLPPISHYQAYQLSDYRSLKEFAGKLLTKYKIKFDEELTKKVLEDSISLITKASSNSKKQKQKTDTESLFSDLKNHIDKRFVEFLDGSEFILQDYNKLNTKRKLLSNTILYTIKIGINFSETKDEQHIEIREDDTVADVLNRIYFLLKKYIKPYTYLEKWILVNPKNKFSLIIREISHMIPAKYVFKQEIVWQAMKLDTPYKPSDSNTNI
jgi:hypothetical protein